MKNPNPPIRRGIAVMLTVDTDAYGLLRAMCPNSKSPGLLISELIRKEARERSERPELLDRLREQALAAQEA